MSTRLIVIGPLPPPYHGVTVSTGLVLANPLLQRSFRLEHLDTSDHRSAENTGQWDVRNVWLALQSLGRLIARLRGDRGVVYLPLSQNRAGLLRDSLFILLAAARGWGVAAHLRGGEFNEVYEREPKLMRWLVRTSLARVHSVAVLGSSLRPLFDRLLPSNRVVVVPNGTPDIPLDGVPRDPKTGLFLSNLRRRKGVIEALDAALLVLQEEPEARFVFIGDWESSELRSELRLRATAHEEKICFLPTATGEAHAAALASAGFFLFPPRQPEGHPRVVLEALAAGLPVITTDRGAIAETVVHEESGFVLQDPVPAVIAEHALRLIRDPDLRERMGHAARVRYLERYTQQAADAGLADWLEQVAVDVAERSA
jgi:glycosyltransferase involved in cell wall biosynthesis